MTIVFDPALEIKNFLLSRKDEPNLARPSIHYLRSYADLLFELCNKWKAQSDTMPMELLSVLRDIDIFKADLTGELQHDYDKSNKRYRGKWLVENAKIKSIGQRLVSSYQKNLELANSSS